MAKFDVIDLKKKKVSEIELSDEIFGGEPNANLFYEVAKMQQINRRAGTVAVKNSSLVSGGGKKPWRQKGTGRARQGSIRASHWVGGGKAMGPKPRDYTYRPPRQVRRAAIAHALALRAKEKTLFIVDAFPSEGKAKAAFDALTKGLGMTSALVVDEKKNEKLHRAVRNLRNFDVLPPEGVNLESVLRRKELILTSAAAKALEASLLKTRGPRLTDSGDASASQRSKTRTPGRQPQREESKS
jgi:large subunit ribosomal protein L4